MNNKLAFISTGKVSVDISKLVSEQIAFSTFIIKPEFVVNTEYSRHVEPIRSFDTIHHLVSRRDSLRISLLMPSDIGDQLAKHLRIMTDPSDLRSMKSPHLIEFRRQKYFVTSYSIELQIEDKMSIHLDCEHF